MTRTFCDHCMKEIVGKGGYRLTGTGAAITVLPLDKVAKHASQEKERHACCILCVAGVIEPSAVPLPQPATPAIPEPSR